MVASGLAPILSKSREGLEEHIFNLATAIGKLKKVDLELIDSKGGFGKIEGVKYRQISNIPKIVSNRAFASFRSLTFILHALLYPADITHVHVPLHSIVASKFRKIVYTSHSPWWYMGGRRIDKMAVKSADVCIALSKEMKKAIEAAGAKRVVYIPNGVDVDKYKPREHEFKNRILFVGRISEQKGITYLIDALSMIKEPFEMVFVGPMSSGFRFDDYSYYNSVMKRIEKYGLENKVKFLGTVDEKIKIKEYQKADIFVLPSIGEGMSLVMLEAMASGLPVVVSDVSGVRDAIEDGKEGLIVKKQKPSEIADRLEYLLANSEITRKMGANARKKAIEFSWEKVAKKTINVYLNYQ